MNIQQLNAQGKNLSDFIATAAIAVFLTGGSWLAIEQMNGFLAWRNRDRDPDHKLSAPEYDLTIRLSILMWLVKNGHWSWMLNSGAGYRILVNEISGYRPVKRGQTLDEWTHASEGVPAIEYFLKFSTNQTFRSVAFQIQNGSWNKSEAWYEKQQKHTPEHFA